MKPRKEILTVEYNPVLDKYYMPSRSRGSRIAKWEVFQSRRTDEWYCNCERFCIGLQYKGECRHIQLAKYYKKNEWEKKHMVIRERD
jgi:hypothetical protein